MTNKPVELQTGYVAAEGDEIYYEVRGHGQPLLMISGGGGDARPYSFVADMLSDEYKVITYDRRAYSRSSMDAPQNFEISQQSRDAVAVLRAAGETSAHIFGNSSGAVIALDLAKSQPQAVEALVAHEPPLACLHPQARKWQRFFASVYWTAFGLSVPLAMLRFVLGVGLPLRLMARPSWNADILKAKRREISIRSENVSDFFVKQELLPVTNYRPDVETIKKNGIKVFMAAGKTSLDKKRFYAQTAPILAEMLCCEMVVFPGHHVSYLDMPEEWAAVLRTVLHKAVEQVN